MQRRPAAITLLTVSAALAAVAVAPQGAGAAPAAAPTSGVVGGFSYGELQSAAVSQSGCGTNTAGEPSIHVTRDNLVVGGSEEGVGSGSEVWSQHQVGGAGASGCGLVYRGQPNAVNKTGPAGGDIDIAVAPREDPTADHYRIYVASLNLGSISVSTSTDNGKTYTTTPVQAGIPVDDREWIAADGPATALLTYHDIPSNNIDVLKSTNGGQVFTQVAQAIPPTDYKAQNNELGNIVIDHVNRPSTGFRAYQAFVAPSKDPGLTGSSTYNEGFVAVSSDGGTTWTDKPIPCSTAYGANGLAHNFPNVSVAPNGALFFTTSNDTGIHVAKSTDNGNSWTCSGTVSTPSRAIYPWLVATSAGEDLVYYGSTGSGATQQWSVYFAQNTTQTLSGWTTKKLMPVHVGTVCEGGIDCTGGRQLFDDFGVDTDKSGWAHIMYSHDAPNLGGTGSFTGYAVQQTGTRVGRPN